MKKFMVVCVCLIFLLSVPLFAEWKIGNIVDDFGDPTGEKFVYTIVDGTFSNSATTSSPCSVRVLSQYEATPFPKEEWVFEIHEYGFDNPVNTFRSDSEGTIKIKDELNKVHSFPASNNKYDNKWNKLFGTNAKAFTDLVRNNNRIKVAIACDSTRYNFEIPTNEASDIISSVESGITPRIGEWIKEDTPSYMLEFYEYFISEYKKINITKTFPLYSWNYYDVVPINGIRYLVHLTIDDEDLAEDGYAKFNVSAYSLDDKNATVESYGKMKKVTFVINDTEYTLTVKDPEKSTGFTNMSEMKKITKALASSRFTSISISYVEKKVPLELALNGQEMAKIINSL